MKNRVVHLIITLIAVVGTAAIAATENWNEAGNWVSYTETGIVDNDMGVGGVITKALDKFNQASALSKEGVACTLTKVVIAIDGQLDYSIEVDSENPTASPFTVLIVGTGATVSHGIYSAVELYGGSSSLSLGADSDGDADFTGSDYGQWAGINPGQGVGSFEITSGLSYFTTPGPGVATLDWDVNYQLVLGVSGPNAASRTSGTGTAEISITYYYEPVPEPATWALIGVGGLVLGLRRRFIKKA